MTSHNAPRQPPTVIVARTPAAGKERELERWLRRLVDAAAAEPGYVDADVQRPNELHPNEWVIVYRFDRPQRLQRWLASPQRAELLAEGAHLVDGDAREQVVAPAPHHEPVTAVSSVRVRPGEEAAYRDLHREVVETLQTFDGFLHSDLYEPVPGVQDETVVVFAFDTREHLDRWLRSEQRRRLLERMDALTDTERTVNVVGGFAGWFGDADDGGVRRWKQALVVLAALYPTALTLSTVRELAVPGLPLPLAVLVVNIGGVAVLTWLLMPLLTRWLAGWLHR